MDIFGIIGTIGGLLFFVKVFIHVLLIRVTTGKLPSDIGAFSNIRYFASVVQDVKKEYHLLKLIANGVYWTSVVLLVAFLIDFNLSRKHI